MGPIRPPAPDVDLLNQLNRTIFWWSGGNATSWNAIGGANEHQHGPRPGPGFYWTGAAAGVATEHTLFNEGTPTIYSRLDPSQGTPLSFFSYRPSGTPSIGQPVNTINLGGGRGPRHLVVAPERGDVGPQRVRQ